MTNKPYEYSYALSFHHQALYFLFFSGVEQKRVDYDNVVVTDGLELQRVVDSVRGNIPTEATTLSDQEEEERRDLQSAPATGLEDSDTPQDESRKNVEDDSLTDSGNQVGEDENNSHDVKSKKLSNNKRRLTSQNDRERKNRHDIRTNRNYELKERLNIDSERNKDQRQATRDSLVKVGQDKSGQTAEQGKTAELQSSNGGFAVVPNSNLSSSTPPPYILKVKNTPARAELDDIYFLCKSFSLFSITHKSNYEP